MEAFYDLCDEFGLLVWQEFMFACAMYPVNREFLESVRTEVDQNVKRLMHHPCVALWSGSNENEEALVTAWYEPVKKNPFLYAVRTSFGNLTIKVDYNRLYIDTIMPAVKRLDTTRAFISSSPYNGVVSEDPYVLRFKVDRPHLYGDTHYYNYKDDGTDVSKFPKCRFASEYGFQAMPWFSTFKKISQPVDWHPLSPFMIRRNHHRFGQEEILAQMSMHFPLPFQSSKSAISESQFDAFCVLSQIVQTMCVRAQTEHYRRLSGHSEYRCMGALYWQCNDIWQAPTWSGMEYGGRWKLLQNAIKHVFEPVLLTMHRRDDGHFVISLCNDLSHSISGTVELEVWSWSQGACTHKRSIEFQGVGMSAELISSAFQDCVKDVSDVIFVLSLNEPYAEATAEFFPDSFRSVKPFLTKPRFQMEIISSESDSFGCAQTTLSITSDGIVPWVSEEANGVAGRFDPNGFLLLPNVSRTVTFRSLRPCTNLKLGLNDIRAASLFDLLHCQ